VGPANIPLTPINAPVPALTPAVRVARAGRRVTMSGTEILVIAGVVAMFGYFMVVLALADAMSRKARQAK
jgi:hypothetical protein